MAVAYRKTSLGGRHIRERWSQKSDANTAQTCSTDPAASERASAIPRRLHAVFVHYSGDVTKDVTVTLNSGVHSDYDTLLNTLAIAAGKDAFWVCAEPVPIMEDDVIDVVAPAGGGTVTSTVLIVTEADEP